MRTRTLVALGVVAYGAFLVATVPASVVTDAIARGSSGRVAFEGVEGSAWNGRAALRGQSEVLLDEVAWRFQPARLLAGEAAFAVNARRAGFDATAVVARTPGELRLREVKAQGSAASVVPLFPLASAWQPEGSVSIESDEFALGGNDSRGTARIEWREAALSLAPARPLGSWKANLTGNGPAIDIALATDKGPLRLAGKGALKSVMKGTLPDFGFTFEGTASADPGREKELEALLALIGPRRPDGLTAITVR
jgi:hypothetical protein